MGFPGNSAGRESACIAGDLDSIPGLGRSPGGGPGNPLQSSCLENPMDKGAWRATAHGVTRVGHNWATMHSTALWMPLLFSSQVEFGSFVIPWSPLGSSVHEFSTQEHWVGCHFFLHALYTHTHTYKCSVIYHCIEAYTLHFVIENCMISPASLMSPVCRQVGSLQLAPPQKPIGYRKLSYIATCINIYMFSL